MAAKTPRSKPQTTATPAPSVRIPKTGSCPSLTGASTLTMRSEPMPTELSSASSLTAAGGLFGREWVA